MKQQAQRAVSGVRGGLTSGLNLAAAALLLAGCQQGPQQGAQPGARASAQGASAQGARGGAAPAELSAVEASAARERAVEIVLASIASQSDQVRANAVEAASYVPARLSGVIAQGLEDPNPGVRSVAAMAVGKQRISDLRERVRPLLRDRSEHVRASAIFAMHALGEEVDPTPLSRMLLESSDPWVARQAAYVLGETRNPSSAPLLQSAARGRLSTLPPVQQRPFQLQVAEALVKVGRDDQRSVLMAALYPAAPGDLEAVALASQILGELKDREAGGQLINLLVYRDERGDRYPAEVRLAAALALGRLGMDNGASVAEEFVNDQSVLLRSQAAFVYGAAGSRWTARLATMLEDPNPLVRISAAGALLRG